MKPVHTGVLPIGDINIPVSIYKSADVFGLEGHLYHYECGGKIRQRLFCEQHPELEEVVTYTGLEVGGEIIPVDASLRNSLLDRKVGFEHVGTYRLTALAPFMTERELVPMCHYRICSPQNKNIDPSVSELNASVLSTLSHRLLAKKMFLLVTIGLGGVKRYGIIMPNMDLYLLFYPQELREEIPCVIPENDSRNLSAHISAVLDETLEVDLPDRNSDLPTYQNRIVAYFKERLAGVPKRIRKSDKELVNA